MNGSSEHRLKRLRDLLAQLERLPATAERDRILREVRARAVDVDTGVDPDPVQAADPGSPTTQTPNVVAPADEGRRPRSTALPRQPKPVHVPPGGTVRRAAGEVPTDGPVTDAGDQLPLALDVLLSLDDSASFSSSETRADLAAAPWTRGLRG